MDSDRYKADDIDDEEVVESVGRHIFARDSERPAGEVDLRSIYKILSIKLRRRIIAMLRWVEELGVTGSAGRDPSVLVRDISAEAEDMEALIAALDGLTRHKNEGELTDPHYVSKYLETCLNLRREGRGEGEGLAEGRRMVKHPDGEAGSTRVAQGSSGVRTPGTEAGTPAVGEAEGAEGIEASAAVESVAPAGAGREVPDPGPEVEPQEGDEAMDAGEIDVFLASIIEEGLEGSDSPDTICGRKVKSIVDSSLWPGCESPAGDIDMDDLFTGEISADDGGELGEQLAMEERMAREQSPQEGGPVEQPPGETVTVDTGPTDQPSATAEQQATDTGENITQGSVEEVPATEGAASQEMAPPQQVQQDPEPPQQAPQEMAQTQPVPQEMAQTQPVPQEMAQTQPVPQGMAQPQQDTRQMPQTQPVPQGMAQPQQDTRQMPQTQQDTRQMPQTQQDTRQMPQTQPVPQEMPQPQRAPQQMPQPQGAQGQIPMVQAHAVGQPNGAGQNPQNQRPGPGYQESPAARGPGAPVDAADTPPEEKKGLGSRLRSMLGGKKK